MEETNHGNKDIDTPRTLHRKQIRHHRLAYFTKPNACSRVKRAQSSTDPHRQNLSTDAHPCTSQQTTGSEHHYLHTEVPIYQSTELQGSLTHQQNEADLKLMHMQNDPRIQKYSNGVPVDSGLSNGLGKPSKFDEGRGAGYRNKVNFLNDRPERVQSNERISDQSSPTTSKRHNKQNVSSEQNEHNEQHRSTQWNKASERNWSNEQNGPSEINVHNEYGHEHKRLTDYHTFKSHDIHHRHEVMKSKVIENGQPEQHHTTVNTFVCGMRDNHLNSDNLKADVKTHEFHFSLDSAITGDANSKPELDDTSCNYAMKNCDAARTTFEVKSKRPTDSSFDRKGRTRDCSVSPSRGGRHNHTRECSISPSRGSAVSDWTVSNLTMDDDLTDVTGLGLATHRPSEPSARTTTSQYRDDHITDVSCSSVGNMRDDVSTDYLLYGDDHNKSDTDRSIQGNYSNHENPEMTGYLHSTMDTEHLREVLGTDKYDRFIKNFEASDDQTDACGLNGQFQWAGHNPDQSDAWNHENNTQPDDLELKTHRPSVGSVKCAFSINEIYDVAGSFGDSGQKPGISGHYHINKPHQSMDANTPRRAEEMRSIVSDTGSSLVGRELRTVRQKPSGPIPQRHRENSPRMNMENSPHNMSQAWETCPNTTDGPYPSHIVSAPILQTPNQLHNISQPNSPLNISQDKDISPPSKLEPKHNSPQCNSRLKDIPHRTVAKLEQEGGTRTPPTRADGNPEKVTHELSNKPRHGMDSAERLPSESIQRYLLSLQNAQPDPVHDSTPRVGLDSTQNIKPHPTEPMESDLIRQESHHAKHMKIFNSHATQNQSQDIPNSRKPNAFLTGDGDKLTQSEISHALDDKFKQDFSDEYLAQDDTSSSLATSKLLRPVSEYNSDDRPSRCDPKPPTGDHCAHFTNGEGLHTQVFSQPQSSPVVGALHSVSVVNCENQQGMDEEKKDAFDLGLREHSKNIYGQRTETGALSEGVDSSTSSRLSPVGDGLASRHDQCASDDDLYTRVTSVVSDDATTGLTERMEKLGINFDFLKDNNNGPNYITEEVIRVSTDDNELAASKPQLSSGLPKASTSGNTRKQKKGSDMVKVCPECAGINRPYMDWCTECGEVLIGINSVPSKLKRTERRNVKDWLQEEASMKAAHKNNHHDSAGLRLSKDTIGSDVRDSDSFQYDNCVKPSESLPNQLRTELSLNVRSSSSTVDSNINHHGKCPDPSEVLDFEYADSEVQVSSLPSALRAELSLNLRDSTDSIEQNKNQTLCNANKNGESNKVPDLKKNGPKSMHRNTDEKLEQAESGAAVIGGQAAAADCSPPLCQEAWPNNAQAGAPLLPNTDHQSQQQPHLLQNQEGDILDDSENYQEFVSRLKNDSRFKPSQSRDGPQRSSSGHAIKHRPTSAGSRSNLFTVKGKVRQSLEKEMFPQRWATSSQEWKDRPSSAKVRPSSAQVRPSSVHVSRVGALVQATRGRHQLDVDAGSDRPRPHSAGKVRSSPSAGLSPAMQSSVGANLAGNRKSDDMRGSAKSNSQDASVSKRGAQSKAMSAMEEMGKYMAMAHGYTSKLYEKDDVVHHIKRPQYKTYLDPEEIELMSPRIHEGKLSMMLCLPEEILVYIFTFISHADLMRCASVCSHFKRIGLDPCLWKKIILKKRALTDDWLIEIGSKKPSSLTMIQCTGEKVTTNGVRELFRQCADQLQELNFTGCQRGHLSGDRLLLHVTNRCRFLTHVDASWSNIDDCGLMALADSCHNLESLCVNGCPTIGDEAIHALVIKHGLYLRTLEVFGCFNLTERGCISITTHCKGLTTLNMGQCWKIPDSHLCHLTASLGMIENLDLRGCKQMKDTCVQNIVRNCPRLVTLAVANCPNLTDLSLIQISSMASNIRSLDVCGCKKLTNTGIKALATGCQFLEYLDISTTGITHKGVCSLANYCNRHLEILKVNFCKQITLPCLVKLARHCRRLKKLYLYGLSGIRDTSEIIQQNRNLWIEM